VLLICEGIFFVLGIFIMVTGRFKVSRNRTVRGTRARVAGFILFLPGPIALLIGLTIGASLARDPIALRQSLINTTIFEIIMVVVALIAALIVARTAPETEIVTSGSPIPSQYSPDILTVGEAAQYVRVTDADILQMITSGQLKAVAIGSDYRISREALNAVFNV
jgi:excisionase family DNA binding protein